MDDCWYSVDVDPPDDTVWVWGPNLTVGDEPTDEAHPAFPSQYAKPGLLYWWSAKDSDDTGEGKPVDGVTHWRPFIVPDPPVEVNEDNLGGLLLEYAQLRHDLVQTTSAFNAWADHEAFADAVLGAVGPDRARSLLGAFKETQQ